MKNNYLICEKCGPKYFLAEAYTVETTSSGKRIKVYSELSDKYCPDCLAQIDIDYELKKKKAKPEINGWIG